ncbi:MAG: 3-oxoacyl-ACP reductase FabG [Deltaproteobacteria bacterium]|nr:MAG: 3-oxoacyl-ACP reductase FabG [Deltaproteobacteria bacterium]
MENEKKVAVVTGGSRGIGRAIVTALAESGCLVHFNYARDAEAARAVSDATGAVAERIDIRETENVSRWIKTIHKERKRIDILVNNAGVTRDTLLATMSEEAWRTVIETNLTGAWNAARAVIRPMLRQREGRIINISSVSGVLGAPGQVNYAAAKAGLIGMTKALAREVASRGITVNAVAPGYIETEMFLAMPEEARQAACAQVPLGRIGTPEEVAALVTFLALGPTDYLTGQVICLDGGLAM